MKNTRFISMVFMLVTGFTSNAQKTISEGTITYDISIQSKNGGTKSNSSLNGAKTTIYLKGGLSRTEMSSSLGNEITIYNAKLGNAAILKEYSGQKLMITLTKVNWEEKNRKFEGLKFENAAETKTIEGYNCKRAIARLTDGSTISVYYTTELITMNKEYNLAFKSLPGFPMEYAYETEKLIVLYQISKIDYNTLPVSKFDFPKSGYRIMSYDENKSGKTEGKL